ncbi:MAG: flagellar filament capping protein FliD [Lachnospiraceae bacterium]|nr:flagellar filament capping protein FliD [Lachnospiraceae bacterium]
MANNLVLSNVYNQYLTTYAPQKSNSRYDAHKRSELKNIYNSMVRVNRDAPLYKIDTSEESRECVIGLKEESRVLHNNIVSVMGDTENLELDARIAYSTNESILSAQYSGGRDEGTSVSDTYDIEVKSLATPQVNLGMYLPKDTRDITPGKYAFDVSVSGQGYEFQYNIYEEETNFDIQNKLSRLINNSGIRLLSSVEEDGRGNAALRIESLQMGDHPDETAGAFTISDTSDRKVSGSVPYLGIDYVARKATDAELVINGEEVTSPSNLFLLDKRFEIKLNGISPEPGITATVGVKPDIEATVENISNLIDSYNGFINSMSSYSTDAMRTNSLFNEMNGIVKTYGHELEQMGITVGEGKTLGLDKDVLTDYMTNANGVDSVEAIKKFTSSILRKSNQISVNPVEYLNKTVVAYKNPGKNFTNPYTASAYSGYMFNSYC